MRIDSSQVGMESARSYTSVSKRSVSTTVVNATVSQGSDMNFGSFSDLLNAGTDLEEGLDTSSMQGGSKGIGSYREITSKREQRAIETVKEQCVLYLIRWLYSSMEKIKRHGGNASQPYSFQDYLANGGNSLNGMNSLNGAMNQMQGNTLSMTMIQTSMNLYYAEEEKTNFSTQGVVKTQDGRCINFQLDLKMSRRFEEQMQMEGTSQILQMTDPLVINLDSDIASLSDQKFEFDIDCDGIKDSISYLNSNSGYLALDKNGDGKINDGSELFGTKSGDGFSDLSAYDEDGNGWIDEADSIFDKLLIWTKDENGKDELYTLKEAGVGALCVQKASTDFSLNSLHDNASNGKIRSTGIYLYENGNVGTMQQLDLTS